MGGGSVIQVVIKEDLVTDPLRPKKHVKHKSVVINFVSVVKFADGLIRG